MPCYALLCGCGNHWEDWHAMAEPHPPCPACAGEASVDYSASRVTANVRNGPRTFGQAAEENSSRLEKSVRHGDASEKELSCWARMPGVRTPERDGARPWWRDGSTAGLPAMEAPLDTSKLKDPERYVVTGEKS